LINAKQDSIKEMLQGGDQAENLRARSNGKISLAYDERLHGSYIELYCEEFDFSEPNLLRPSSGS
jgi:hypothetical protein